MRQLNIEMKHNPSGFTLVELLVVIVLIGVLAAVLVGAINPGELTAKGRDTERLTTSKQVMDAINRYYDANNCYPWEGVSGSCTNTNTPGSPGSATNPVPINRTSFTSSPTSGVAVLNNLVVQNEIKSTFASGRRSIRGDYSESALRELWLYEISPGNVSVCFEMESSQMRKDNRDTARARTADYSDTSAANIATECYNTSASPNYVYRTNQSATACHFCVQ